MRIYVNNRKWIAAVFAVFCIALMCAACGGGTADPGQTLIGGDDPAGVQADFPAGGGGTPITPGDGTPTPVQGDLPTPSEISGASPDAPLGTVEEYDVQQVTPEVFSFTPPKAPSAMVIGDDGYNHVIAITIAADGETPDWEAEYPSYYEGDAIDLWVEYYVNSTYPITRHWDGPTFGLDYNEYGVEHPSIGTYQVKLDYVLPYGSATDAAEYMVEITTTNATIEAPVFLFQILDVDTQVPIVYPTPVDPENDGDDGGCIPEISVVFNGTSIDAVSTKDLSNVVLEFEDGIHEKWDDLDQNPSLTGTFYGTGENDGKTIVAVWIKSGCNASGDGPGYGEKFEPVDKWSVGMAQMAWEDLLVNADYDYNDFVGRLRVIEIRNTDDELVQVQLTVKAVARGAGYDSDWQFNMDAAFPGATAFATIDQYYADGARHGEQRLWSSSDGMSVPVFTPVRDALPNPPDSSWCTNCQPNTTFIEGDYAEVIIVLDTPMPQGTYTPIPYEPELKVSTYDGQVYTIGLWREPGDWVDSNGRPLAFIVPDTYAWPLECKQIWTAFPEFDEWIEWINDQDLPEPTPVWYDIDPVANAFDIDLFY